MSEPGESVLYVGFARDNENYSYQNGVIAKLDGKIIGMILSYVMPEPGAGSEGGVTW